MSKPVHGNVVSIYLEPNKPLRAAVAVMDTVIIDNQILDLEGNPVDLTECTVIVTATDRHGTTLYTVSVTNAEQGRFRVIVQPKVHGQLKLTAKVSIDGAADQYTWFIGSLSVAVDEDGDPAEAIRSLTDDILEAYGQAKEVAEDTKGYSADAKRYSDLALGYSINSQNTANEAALQAQTAKGYADTAHTSELNAGQSSKDALTYASSASDSANSASNSAATATQKAQEASASAESASASAASASTSASQASDSASSASTSASQAKASETNASASEANASTYASSALSSANTAKAMATDAQTFAGHASDSADSASASANSASTSASRASSFADTATAGASTATAQAVIAADKATASANSASQASASATAAKASETNAKKTLNDVLASQETVNGYLSEALKAVIDSGNNAESAATSATNASNSATAASNSAQSALDSKNAANSAADLAQESAQLAQDLAETLIPENLDKRYLAIGGNAVSATKLSTARNINGVSFDGTSDITVKDDTKLPLSGGRMTGTIFTNTPYIISVPKNDGFININGDTDNGGGAYIQIFGRNHSTNPGEIKLIANTTGSESSLRLFPNGSLTWPGTFKTEKLDAVGIELITATPFIDFHYGHSSADYTARIIQPDTGVLQFLILNSAGNQNAMNLYADGNITWRGALVAHYTGTNLTNKWFRLNNGIQVCWCLGYYEANATVTYPIAFAETPGIACNSNARSPTSWSATGFTMEGNASYASWIAVGRWA